MVSNRAAQIQFKKLNDDDIDIKGKPHLNQLTTVDFEVIRKIIKANLSTSTCRLSKKFNIS